MPYTEDQQVLLEVFRMVMAGELELDILSAINNTTGDDEMIIGAVLEDDGRSAFLPIAIFFHPDYDLTDLYTFTNDEMSFDGEGECGNCENCSCIPGEESVECEQSDEPDHDFSVNSKESFWGRLTNWFRQNIMRKSS